ncbi:MAG: hypothetical protein H9882_00315 [Candidatus Fournierella pullistercoris]|uniref:Uncharacterized protein n=1 Tax=Candidatus Allofournierella pullistercoris TaxID=2838597 RepID=A0A948T0Z7_9FIRM|nr:hypothetical protein [Candidatus Fournierella pullistercoris]
MRKWANSNRAGLGGWRGSRMGDLKQKRRNTAKTAVTFMENEGYSGFF